MILLKMTDLQGQSRRKEMTGRPRKSAGQAAPLRQDPSFVLGGV